MKGCFFILLLFIAQCLSAQQCGYENHRAVIVKVIDKDTKLPIRGLKIYLVYEDDIPATQVGTNLKKKHVTGSCIDSFLFWDNLSGKIKSENCANTHMFRRSFPNAGDHYICVVPGFAGKNGLSRFALNIGVRRIAPLENNRDKAYNISTGGYFINLKIEDTDGGKNGGRYNSQKIRIPVAAVTDICKNHLDASSGLLNGEKLNPIVVELKANDALYEAGIEHDAFGRYLVPYYEGIMHRLNPEAEHTIFQLVKMELYDEKTTRVLQTILPPGDKVNDKTWKEGNIQFLNFYNDVNNEMPGFRIPASRWQNNKEVNRNVFFYYRYNLERDLYEEDTLLNNKQETRYDKDTRTMYATDWDDTEDYMIEYNYELKNKQWVLLRTRKHEKVKPKAPVVVPPQAVCYIEVPDKVLPVQYFDSTNLKSIMDTFWLVNYGNAAAAITLKYKDGNYFTFPSSIAPNQRLPIIYHREFIRENKFNNNLQEVRGPFNLIGEGLRLNVNNDKELRVSLSYMMIGGHAVMKIIPDGGLHFEIPHKEDERFVVNTFPNKMWKEYGRIFVPDSRRIGEWTVIDSSEKYLQKQVQYDKVLQVHLENASVQDCRIICYYNWGMLKNPKEYRGKIIVPPNMNSVHIDKDSLKIIYPVDFEEIQQEENVTLFLLKPGQDYFYNGKIKTPIMPDYNRFVVRWNTAYEWEHSKPGPDTDKSWKKKYFNNILESHPSLSYDIDSGVRDFYILDFSRCEEKEKKKIFSMIEKDTNIASLGLMFYDGTKNFCDNKILLIDPANMKLDSTVMSRVVSVGFKYKDTQISPGHYTYTFEYKSKIVGKDFLNAFNYMCETNKKRRFSLNMYMDIRPENPEDNLYKKRGGNFYD